jgi:hypothetical protein
MPIYLFSFLHTISTKETALLHTEAILPVIAYHAHFAVRSPPGKSRMRYWVSELKAAGAKYRAARVQEVVVFVSCTLAFPLSSLNELSFVAHFNPAAMWWRRYPAANIWLLQYC